MIARGPDALGVLAPPSVTITLSGGGALVMSPLRVRQLAPFIAAMGPARDAIAGSADVWQLIADHGDGIAAAMAVAADVPPEAIGDLLPAEFMEALTAMIEVNADFFHLWLFAPARMATMAATE